MATAVLSSPALCRLPAARTAAPAPRRAAPVAAEPKKDGLDFSSNRRSGLGYTAEDSAGQSNIFAVEPKTYVAGSSKDPKAGSGSLVYAVTAGVIGAAAIAAGVSLTAQESQKTGGEITPLSVYVSKFGGASAAPSAPALADE